MGMDIFFYIFTQQNDKIHIYVNFEYQNLRIVVQHFFLG